MPWVTPAYADACFAPSYASARGKFLLAADRAGARLDVLVNAEARAPNGGTLTTDVAVLGPPEAEGALLVISGTHGPEGFVGSAAQIALLDSLVHRAQALWSLNLPTYEPGAATCPGCAADLPLEAPGSSGTKAASAPT